MRTRDNSLFASGYLGDLLRQKLERVSPTVDSILKDQLLATPALDLLEHIYSQLAVEPLTLHEDRMQSSEAETKIDVSGDQNRYFSRNDGGPYYAPGYQIKIEIPFTGDFSLWKLQPSSFKSVYPWGNVSSPTTSAPGTLTLTFSSPIDSINEETLGNNIQRELGLVRFYVESSSSEVAGYNQQLRPKIEAAINSRKERISKTEGLAARLGLPLKRNPDAPNVEPIKMPRKLVRPLPPPPNSGYKPEPGIEDESFEHILNVIRHEIATYETTPKTYKNLGEEDLRNILLAHLNGHYEGGATGETFRYGGKTDIRIEAENRAAFVAECKLWSGANGVTSALNQLVGYLTWRDCKAALVIFNKSIRGFSEIIDKCADSLESHNLCKGEIELARRASEWRFRFQSPTDELREVIIHVFLANLYVEKDA